MTKESTDGLRTIKDGAPKEDTRKLFSLESSQHTKTKRSMSLYGGQESVLLKHLPKVEIFDSKLANSKESKSNTEEKLDSKKSVAELIASKRIKDKRESATVKALTKPTKTSGDSDDTDIKSKDLQRSQKCKVKVLSDEAAEKELSSGKKPHFVVKRNGDIECLKDPENAPTEEISVVVEPRRTNETQVEEEAQNRNTEDLKVYLSERLSAKGRQVEIETVKEVEKASVRAPEVSESTYASRSENGDARPQAPGPRSGVAERAPAPSERTPAPSERAQIEHAQQSTEAAPKQFTYDAFMSWLFREMKASNATSFEALMWRLGEQGKLPKEVVAKFTDRKFLKEFEQFMQTWAATGKTPMDTDMQKFFPAELRAAILGVEISELDANSCAITDGGIGAPSEFALRIAQDAKEVALRMRTSGYCFRGVKRSLRENEVNLDGRSAYMAKEQLERDDRFQKILTTDNLTSKHLLPGDVIVHPKGYMGPGRYKPHGHIAVYLGNGREASDHVTNLIGGKAFVFRPKNGTSKSEV